VVEIKAHTTSESEKTRAHVTEQVESLSGKLDGLNAAIAKGFKGMKKFMLELKNVEVRGPSWRFCVSTSCCVFPRLSASPLLCLAVLGCSNDCPPLSILCACSTHCAWAAVPLWMASIVFDIEGIA